MKQPTTGLNRNNAALAFIVIFFSLFAASHARADYPAQTDSYVSDFAGLLNQSDRQMISGMLQELEASSGIRMSVVIINSLTDYGTGDQTLASFSRNLFNDWGFGKGSAGKSILMLVALKDRDLRIELGDGYDKSYDPRMQDVIERRILPYFRDEDYSRGIYEGVRGIISKVTKKSTVNAGLRGILTALLMLFVIAALIITGIISKKWFRNRGAPQEQDVFGGGASGTW